MEARAAQKRNSVSINSVSGNCQSVSGKRKSQPSSDQVLRSLLVPELPAHLLPLTLYRAGTPVPTSIGSSPRSAHSVHEPT